MDLGSSKSKLDLFYYSPPPAPLFHAASPCPALEQRCANAWLRRVAATRRGTVAGRVASAHHAIDDELHSCSPSPITGTSTALHNTPYTALHNTPYMCLHSLRCISAFSGRACSWNESLIRNNSTFSNPASFLHPVTPYRKAHSFPQVCSGVCCPLAISRQ
jgi:hypothetical protein